MKRLLLFLIPCLLLAGCQFSQAGSDFSQTQFLMDTVCTIRSDSESAITAAFFIMQEIQAATDYYREASTVSRFNRAKANQPVPLDSHTEAIVTAALAVSDASKGSFDITIAPAKALWDFYQGAAPPEKTEVNRVLPLIGRGHLVLDTDAHTLAKTMDGVAIDLGGCAKGYAADMAKSAMLDAGATWGVLDLGGNVVVFGKNPNRKNGSWEIGIQDPDKESGIYAQTVSLPLGGAVVTSGSYQRSFSYDGILYHHILDPKTGFPAKTETQSATVVGESALLADCLSTACLILGREESRALEEQFGVTVLFID